MKYFAAFIDTPSMILAEIPGTSEHFMCEINRGMHEAINTGQPSSHHRIPPTRRGSFDFSQVGGGPKKIILDCEIVLAYRPHQDQILTAKNAMTEKGWSFVEEKIVFKEDGYHFFFQARQV